MIVIIDYGLGNLGSIRNMLKKIGVESVISSEHEVIEKADKLVLPGVGAFDNGMENLQEQNLIELLNQKVLIDKTPILGICLGMQLMTNESEEGLRKGLGWVNAETLKFRFDEGSKMKVPFMGWNYLKQMKQSKLLTEMFEDQRFYFVHSYYVKAIEPADILGTSFYGSDYVSAFEKDNILGVQFHPEKSHKFGMKLLKNFAENY